MPRTMPSHTCKVGDDTYNFNLLTYRQARKVGRFLAERLGHLAEPIIEAFEAATAGDDGGDDPTFSVFSLMEAAGITRGELHQYIVGFVAALEDDQWVVRDMLPSLLALGAEPSPVDVDDLTLAEVAELLMESVKANSFLKGFGSSSASEPAKS